MSKCAIVEAVYDGMVARGLREDHEAFEDILMACCAVAESDDPSASAVLDWCEEREYEKGTADARTALQIFMDWRTYLNGCSKKSMKLSALLAALVQEGVAARGED